MSFDLSVILELGELDRKLIRLRKRRDAAPDMAAPQRARVDKAKRELSELGEQDKEAAKGVKRLELDAKAKEADIAKAQVALNQAKNNDEYQALTRTIATRQEELNALETEILEAYEAQESREELSAKAKERIASQEKELAEALERVKETQAKHGAEIEGLETQRAELLAKLSDDHRELYERLLARLGDSAVAEVRDEICQGCLLKIRPEQVSLVRGGTTMVTCSDCGRILWGKFG